MRGRTDKGTDIAIALGRDQQLTDGSVLLLDEDRAIVSEPLGNRLPGAWIEIAESTAIIVQPGPDDQVPFTPQQP